MGQLNWPTAHLQHFAGVVDDLITGQNGEVPRHVLDDGAQAVHGRSYGDGAKTKLGDWRIDNAFRTEFFEHPLGCFIGAVVFGYFFAKQEYAVISPHFLAHGLAHPLHGIGWYA